MTTYTYKCTNEECDKHEQLFEVKQSMHDDPLTVCKHCLFPTLVKVIGWTQVLFMGDGWPSNENKGLHHVNGKERGMK